MNKNSYYLNLNLNRNAVVYSVEQKRQTKVHNMKFLVENFSTLPSKHVTNNSTVTIINFTKTLQQTPSSIAVVLVAS